MTNLLPFSEIFDSQNGYFSNNESSQAKNGVTSFEPELFSRPGRSQGLLYKQLCNSFIDSVILFLPQLYGAITPKQLEIALPVRK